MKKIISLLLIATTLVSLFAISVSAATREEEFLSDVALVYEDSVEEAKEVIAGTEWKLFEKNLNPKADYMFDDGVYLVYKTSTNVEDAITDLRVMDMYGGFSSANYKKQLEASRAGYMKLIGDLRIVADEFKSAYNRVDRMARLAAMQMGLYRDIQTVGGTETGLYMDEFFLNMPSDDQIVQVLMEGNAVIVSNLITLLAIGISGEGEASLATQIAEKFAIKDSLKDAKYYEDAVTLYEALTPVRAKLLRYDALAEQYNFNDEEMTEEEYVFWTSIAPLAKVLEEIKFQDKYTDTTLAAMLRKGTYTEQDLYPIVAALTEGQMALVRMGQIETIFKNGAPTKPYDELRAYLDEQLIYIRDEYGEAFQNGLDVYTGVDRSLFKGSFAMTNAAERQQALTGETWDIAKAADSSWLLIASYVVAGFGAASACISLGIAAPAVFYKTMSVATALLYPHTIGAAVLKGGVNSWGLVAQNYMTYWGFGMKGFAAIAGGLVLIAAGMAGIALWYNYYNPDYTEIPNVLVDVRETDLGDKYVKYTAAKVYGEERNADFNAYEGKEWNALYYSKDAVAGNCLTPKFVYKDNDATIARRHQGISMFGETEAFNLNEHVYNDNAPGVYVTVRYSTTEKAVSVPSAIGSMFATGALYTLTALGGAGLGVGGTILVQKTRKKNEDPVTELSGEN